MNLLEEVNRLKEKGYSEENAQARVCQDIILYGISRGSFSGSVTVKGGVVMRNISRNARRATQDIDLDFIRYSISDDSIESFINKLYLENGIHILLEKPIVELNHKDYKGKRVFVKINDEYGNSFESKIDIGVHNDLDIEQQEYCFDICFKEDRAGLLMNSKEQIIVEKLKSFLRFGSRSTRYKDVFDICYLWEEANKDKLLLYIQKYIYNDKTLSVNDINEVVRRIGRVFRDDRFIREVDKSMKNWMDISTEEVLEKNIMFVKSLIAKQ